MVAATRRYCVAAGLLLAHVSPAAGRKQALPPRQPPPRRDAWEGSSASQGTDGMKLVLIPMGSVLPDGAIPVQVVRPPRPPPMLRANQPETYHAFGEEHGLFLDVGMAAIGALGEGESDQSQEMQRNAPVLPPGGSASGTVTPELPAAKETSVRKLEDLATEIRQEFEQPSGEGQLFLTSFLFLAAAGIGLVSARKARARKCMSRCFGRDLYDDVHFDAIHTSPDNYMYSTFSVADCYPWKGNHLDKFDV